jgi:hypothetical protein
MHVVLTQGKYFELVFISFISDLYELDYFRHLQRKAEKSQERQMHLLRYAVIPLSRNKWGIFE